MARSPRIARRHRSTRSSRAPDAGRAWLLELEAIKDPWFNMATGDGLTHHYRSWHDDPSIPYAALTGHVAALRAGIGIERPTQELARERDRLADEYGGLLDEEFRPAFDGLLSLSRLVFPYVEEHKFFCDYWFLTSWWNKIREFGALLAASAFLEDGEDVFQLTRYEVASALDELTLTWATGGRPAGPGHWPPIVARRKDLLEKLGEWSPPPALGIVPEAITDPMTIMLWGVTTERVQEWARQEQGGDAVLRGAPASAGIVEGPARVVRSVRPDLRGSRRGDPRVRHHLARVGADLHEDQGDRHRRGWRDVARGHREPRVRDAGGRRHRACDVADTHRADDPRRRSEGHGDGAGRGGGLMEHARGLAGLSRADEPRFGGKSANLGELIGAGIPVPPGFALSIDAFGAFLEESGLGALVAQAAAVAPGDLDAIGALSHSISEAMHSAHVPESVREAVSRGYEQLAAATGVSSPPVAVRSSAVGEDSEDATFAGQQETYLWVRGAEHVCDAVRDCWVSLYSAPAISYRARLGRPWAPAMGVTVQLMVDAEVSGVMFTCSPLTGDPSVVAINASWGLGIAVVGGEVTPDDFLISKVTGEVRPRAGQPQGGAVRARRARPRHGPRRGSRGASGRPLPRLGRARQPRRARASCGAPFRCPPGRRMGDRPRRHRPGRPVRRAGATGHRDRTAQARRAAGVGDRARDEHVRCREG